ncbi:hypothetical protein KY332_03650 [Candidatus Woesearchaeota archaeon]|nr:hypothetical protein [Candidatus Woesearchaeota archaeon]
MNLIQKAFQELYPEKTLLYNTKLIYSGRFKAYNANASRSITTLTIKLSKHWQKISEDIQIGLIQSMLVKIFKHKKKTFNMDLYTNFVKHVHIAVPKTKSDPLLEASFNRVNEKYFYSLIEQPNLKWGHSSVRKLGSYDFHSDEITVSSIFKNQPLEILDYVMYHEMLHKKHKFHSTKTGRSYHHTKKFKQDEKAFENSRYIEKELAKICRKARIKRVFFPYSLK